VWRYDLQSLAAEAERIFVGRCTAAATEQVGDRLYTRVELAVDDMVKGRPARRVQMRLPGGVLNGRRSQMVGMPAFRPGEEVVLFVTEDDPVHGAWPLGLAQGKFRIERRGVAKTAYVVQDLAGISFPEGAVAKRAGVGGAPFPRGLDEFLAQLRSMLGEPTANDDR
jgi:hypothetical protein